MFGRLLALFTIVPLVELYLLIKIGQLIGALPTVLIVVGTGIAGAWPGSRERRCGGRYSVRWRSAAFRRTA